MTAASLSIITRLREAGATLTRSDDGRVRFSSPTSIPADLLAEARQHREGIAAALAAAALPPRPDATPETIAAWAERAAAYALDGYEAPEPPPDWSEAESERLQSLMRKMADGYLRAALRRPPSWWCAEAHRPTPGATCTFCGGARWWSRDRCGWYCATCHPSDGLTDTEFEEVRA